MTTRDWIEGVAVFAAIFFLAFGFANIIWYLDERYWK